MNLVETSVIRNGDIIKRSTRYGMLLNRREDVHNIIKTVGGEPEVEGIRIYNKRGEIIFSTKSQELFTVADMQSESCSPCHSVSKPRSDLTDKERIRVFKNPTGKRILGLISPIRNEAECSNAECHVHPNDVEILGVLDVQMSLESVDNQIKKNRNSLVFSSVIITIIIAVFSGVFIWVMVHIPVKKLIRGTKEISSGNLNYTLQISSKDEVGDLAESFNMMSKNLDKAYNEIKEWNEKLNIKVQEKTNQLKEIYEHIVQIERIASLGKLSATVAHELNNPLEGILTYSKLIIKKLRNIEDLYDKDKIISFLELISTESERCGNIVKNLLLFSRSSTNVIERENIILILERSTLLIAHHLEINNITLVKKFECQHFEIDCDKNQIHQALVAILINAVEAMPEGGTLTLTFKIEKPNVKIIVEDTGAGIPKENLDKIFEPFYTTKEKGKGTGLGLSIVYGIINQHNGSIKIDSEIGKGTKVTITLPIEKTELSDNKEIS